MNIDSFVVRGRIYGLWGRWELHSYSGDSPVLVVLLRLESIFYENFTSIIHDREKEILDKFF